MAIPEKYSHISFVPPAGVRREAARGLAMRREHGRGGTAVGIARARDLSNGTELSPSTLRRMKAFFDRHAQDRKATGFRPGEEGFPSNGKIADLLWGGRSGESWCNKVVRQMNAADERSYSLDADTATLEEEAVLQRSALMNGVERRYFGSFEKADSNSLTVEHRADPETGKRRTYIVGYAAKFGTDSLLLGDFIERLEPTAFDIVKAGKDKNGKPLATRCLFNHDPNHLLGRFPTTMKLVVDKIGLRYECLLPESRKDIEESIARGDLKGSSFSFVIDEDGGEKWITEDGQSIRLVRKIKSLLDVSPVTYPAYDDATVAIAKRSYEAFSSEKKKIVGVRSNVASEIEKTRAFINERRGFCATGPGGGVDNSCGSSSDPKQAAQQALDKYEAARKTTGGKIAEVAAKGAILGGAVGLAGGAVGAAIGSITGALLNVAGHGAAAAISSIAKGNLDSLVQSIGTTHESLSSASQSLFGGDKKPFAIDSKTIAIESGDSIALVSSGSQFSKSSGTAFHFQPGADVGGKLDITAVEKAAKAVGAKIVSAEAWSDKDVKALTSKGYRQVAASPGGYSTSKGVYEKKLSRSKRSEQFAAEYEKTMAFFEERAFCATGPGGGVDNSCGKFMQMDVSSADSVKKSAKDAQEFIDKAREEQLSKGGKDKGQSDDGGGVQTWSKGDHFPWTVKRVGGDEGHVQGLHPDGSKTEKYPFKGGDTSEAMKKVSDEITRRKNSRADQVIADTLKFLKGRRA